MSILIRGMEMPKNCENCMDTRLNVAVSLLGAMCPFCEKIFLADIDIKKQRLDDCPLIELPPHGRLIDADAVNKAMDERIEKLKDDKSIYEASCVATALDMFAPTVIEAEV